MYFCISFTFYFSTPVGATWALTIAKMRLYRNLIIHGGQRFKTISYGRLKNTEFVRKPFYSVGFVFRVLVALWLTLVAGETRKTPAPRRWMFWVRAKEWLMERGLFRIPSHRRWWFNSWSCSGWAERPKQPPDPNSSPRRCSRRGCWCHWGYLWRGKEAHLTEKVFLFCFWLFVCRWRPDDFVAVLD